MRSQTGEGVAVLAVSASPDLGASPPGAGAAPGRVPRGGPGRRGPRAKVTTIVRRAAVRVLWAVDCLILLGADGVVEAGFEGLRRADGSTIRPAELCGRSVRVACGGTFSSAPGSRPAASRPPGWSRRRSRSVGPVRRAG